LLLSKSLVLAVQHQYRFEKIGQAELYLVANNLFDESAVGYGSGNLGS
jgi:hypothetical protein